MSHYRLVLIAITITCSVLITIGFNNCSGAKFSASESSMVTAFDAGGGVLINNGDEFTTSETIALTVSHNSAKEMYITNDSTCQSGGVWEPYATSKSWKLAQANSVAEVFAKFREKPTDGVQGACLSDTIVHDDAPPSLILTKGIATFLNKTDASLEFVASDSGSGIQAVECKTDGAAASSCGSHLVLSGILEGSHSVRVVARDRAGNISQPITTAFIVDLTAPTVMFNKTPSLITNQTASEFIFSGADQLSGIDHLECRIDAAMDWETCTSPINRVMAAGTHNISIRSLDKAGNVSIEAKYNWKIDTTAPTVTITKMPNPYTNSVTATFEFTGMDNGQPITKFECTIDAGTVSGAGAACASPLNVAHLTAGPHEFSVVGVDSAGNRSSPTVYKWIIDLTLPTVSLTQTPGKNSSSKNAEFIFTAQDTSSGIDRIECQLDGASYATCVSPKNYLALPEGEHQFNVRAFDKAGNTSQVVSYVWRIDVTKPIVEITSGPPAWVNVTGATLAFQGTDVGGSGILRYECTIDAIAYSVCSSPKSYMDLKEGIRLFSVRAIDNAGNISDAKSYSWSIDVTAPAISFQKMPPATVQSYYLTGSTATVATVQYTVIDAGVGITSVSCGLNGVIVACREADEYSWSNQTPGVYKFTVLAKDKLGNSSTNEITWTVLNDKIEMSQTVEVKTSGKIDFLVIIDNSGSMATEQSNMADRFGTFIDQLAGLDWQIAIVTTDVSSDAVKKDGRFLEMNTMPGKYVLTSAMPIADAKVAFGRTIQRPASEGSGNEQGIAAIYRAIQRSLDLSKTVNIPNASFWRSDAAFGALVVTDADETNPLGTQIQNKPSSVVDLVRSTWPGKAFSYHSIIVKPSDANCLSVNGNEGYGASYVSLSQLTGGIIGSVCEPDYGSQLTTIGKKTIELVRSATLSCLPLDNNGDGVKDVSIVTADGSPAPGYVIDGTKITFDRALPAGMNRLSYICLK